MSAGDATLHDRTVPGEPALDERIAARVLALRRARGWSLEALARASGVSRSMISLVERGESCPTAVVLDKLATALGVPLASLFDAPTPAQPLAERARQPVWQDPQSGYRRRSVSPTGVPTPIRIVEVDFPPGATVAFETGERQAPFHQQVWLLEGRMEIRLGDTLHRLARGDCLAMQVDTPVHFHNPGPRAARYAVVIAVPAGPRGAEG